MFTESSYSKNKDKENILQLDNYDYISKSFTTDNSNKSDKKFQEKCDLAFTELHSPYLVLGLRYLKRYYTIFDFERNIVGISTDKKKVGTSFSYSDFVFAKNEMDSLIDQFRINNEWTRILQ